MGGTGNGLSVPQVVVSLSVREWAVVLVGFVLGYLLACWLLL